MDGGQKMSKGISRYSFWHSKYYDVIFYQLLTDDVIFKDPLINP